MRLNYLINLTGLFYVACCRQQTTTYLQDATTVDLAIKQFYLLVNLKLLGQ